MTMAYEALLEELAQLRTRVEESEATVEAIRNGEVDAVVVNSPREAIYTLENADKPYRLVIDAVRQGAATIDGEGRLLYTNPYFASLLGRAREELEGTPVQHLVVEEDRAAFADALRRAATDAAHGEFAFRRAGGQRFPAGVSIHVLPSRRVLCLILDDLTPQKRFEELSRARQALAESEERLRLALECTQTGMWVWDLARDEWLTTPLNDALLGLPAGRTRFEPGWLPAVVYPADRPAVERALEACARGEVGTFDLECRVAGPDGATRWIHMKGRVVADALGRPARLIGTSVDATARKTTEDRLRQADRQKDEFLATLAHELRSPLGAIQNAIQLLRIAPEPDPAERSIGLIERQVAQLVRLVDDLSDLSRIARGQVRLSFERAPLARILQEAVETSKPLVERGRHQLVVRVPESPIVLTCDPARLVQVFGNLLNNAARYTPPGGRIELSAEQVGGDALVRIRDDGQGISPEFLPRIFEMFYQGDGASRQSNAGLGIGLALVRNLVDLHGGAVAARSDGRGKGSEFVVRLPVAEDAC